MTRVLGQDRSIETSATVARSATRAATAALSTRASGCPSGTCARARDGRHLGVRDPDDLDAAHRQQRAEPDHPPEGHDDEHGRRGIPEQAHGALAHLVGATLEPRPRRRQPGARRRGPSGRRPRVLALACVIGGSRLTEGAQDLGPDHRHVPGADGEDEVALAGQLPPRARPRPTTTRPP